MYKWTFFCETNKNFIVILLCQTRRLDCNYGCLKLKSLFFVCIRDEINYGEQVFKIYNILLKYYGKYQNVKNFSQKTCTKVSLQFFPSFSKSLIFKSRFSWKTPYNNFSSSRWERKKNFSVYATVKTYNNNISRITSKSFPFARRCRDILFPMEGEIELPIGDNMRILLVINHLKNFAYAMTQTGY